MIDVSILIGHTREVAKIDMARNVNTNTVVYTVNPLATHWVKLYPQDTVLDASL